MVFSCAYICLFLVFYKLRYPQGHLFFSRMQNILCAKPSQHRALLASSILPSHVQYIACTWHHARKNGGSSCWWLTSYLPYVLTKAQEAASGLAMLWHALYFQGKYLVFNMWTWNNVLSLKWWRVELFSVGVNGPQEKFLTRRAAVSAKRASLPNSKHLNSWSPRHTVPWTSIWQAALCSVSAQVWA